MTLPKIDPAGLFDVAGKSALVVGATGAFGKIACATLGAAGARLTITAGNATQLKALEGELLREGIPTAAIAMRPNTEADSQAMVDAGHKAGREIPYWQMEKLHNLEALPASGFEVSCFPVKIRGASAGWTRAVAIFEA